MILREATDADLPDITTFIKRELTAWGFDVHTTTVSVRALFNARRRFAFVTEDDAIVAVGTMHPIKTDRGPTYEIPLLLTSATHPDWLRVMDALSLFICNLLSSEGIQYLVSRQTDHPHVTGLYDRYGFSQFVSAGDYRWVRIETPIDVIFRARPEWRPSP